MVKYYEELEKNNSVYLPLIDYRINDKYIVKNYEMPISFFEKHKLLFEIINDINSILNSINLDDLYNNIIKKYNKEILFDYKNYYIDMDIYSAINELITEKFPGICNLQSKISLDKYDLGRLIFFYKEAVYFLSYIYPDKEDKFNNIDEYLRKVSSDLGEYGNIKIIPDDRINLYLPDNWYITPYNRLYNSGDKDSHKVLNLVYTFNDIEENIKKGVSINSGPYSSNYYFERYKRIRNENYITNTDFTEYLNYVYTYVSFDKSFERRCHDPRIIETVLGVVSANMEVYRFFENLQKYTINPKKEYERLLELTAFDKADILVRCCGFHKMNVCKQKVISTSKINCGEDFYEYLKRGWDVEYRSPIIVNREKGIVEELNNSLYIDKCIDRDRKKYEKIKEYGYGNIRL